MIRYELLKSGDLAGTKDVSLLVHEMTLKLPKFEQFEEGQQIRRSVKSVRSNIVEGYGRRRYVGEYIRFLIIAQASNDETIDHLETLFETKSITDQIFYIDIHERFLRLGRKLNNLLKQSKKASDQRRETRDQ